MSEDVGSLKDIYLAYVLKTSSEVILFVWKFWEIRYARKETLNKKPNQTWQGVYRKQQNTCASLGIKNSGNDISKIA